MSEEVVIPFEPVPPAHVADVSSQLIARVSRDDGERLRLNKGWKDILKACREFMVDHASKDLAGWVLLQVMDLCEEEQLLDPPERESLCRACAVHLVQLGMKVPEVDNAAHARQAMRMLGESGGPPTHTVGSGGLGNMLSLRSGTSKKSRKK